MEGDAGPGPYQHERIGDAQYRFRFDNGVFPVIPLQKCVEDRKRNLLIMGKVTLNPGYAFHISSGRDS